MHNAIKTIKELIACNYDLTVTGNNLETHLHYACNYNQYEIMKILIKHGCNINHKNNWKETPFIFALQTNNYEIIKYLIKKGANINNICYEGTILDSYIVLLDLKIVELFLQNLLIKKYNEDIIKPLTKHDKTHYYTYDFNIKYLKQERYNEIVEYMNFKESHLKRYY